MSPRNKVLSDIALKILDIPTLESRNSDSLDFHEVCVFSLKRALEAAFQAGQMAGTP